MVLACSAHFSKAIQPKSKEKIKSTVHPVGLILTIVHELVSEIEEASKPNAPLVPGVEQCQFCKAKAVCPALKEKSLTSIGLKVESPGAHGDHTCSKCGNLIDQHGWIDTLEGGHIVCPGDWIITGVKGERYPCKPDIFEATYEKA